MNMITECLINKSAKVPAETIVSNNNSLQIGSVLLGFGFFTKENKRESKQRKAHSFWR